MTLYNLESSAYKVISVGGLTWAGRSLIYKIKRNGLK